MLLISEIVIIRQVEQPIRYRPPQANLVTIRAKANRLTLFNKKQLISNYSAPPMGMSNRLTVVLQQELH